MLLDSLPFKREPHVVTSQLTFSESVSCVFGPPFPPSESPQFATAESLHQHSIADFVSSGSILFRLAFEYVPPPADPNAIGNFQRLFSQRTVRSFLRLSTF
jgi:hypothetical protein